MVEKTVTGIIPEVLSIPNTSQVYNIITEEPIIIPARNVITSIRVQLNYPKPINVTQINDNLTIGLNLVPFGYIELFRVPIDAYLNKNSVLWIDMINSSFIKPFYFDTDNELLVQSLFTNVTNCDIYIAIKYKEFLIGDRKN
jgi:hypothetical protein